MSRCRSKLFHTRKSAFYTASLRGGSEALGARPDHVSFLCLAWYCMSNRESCIRIKLSIPRFSLRGMGEMEGGEGVHESKETKVDAHGSTSISSL